jgi:hypothetical protein
MSALGGHSYLWVGTNMSMPCETVVKSLPKTGATCLSGAGVCCLATHSRQTLGSLSYTSFKPLGLRVIG